MGKIDKTPLEKNCIYCLEINSLLNSTIKSCMADQYKEIRTFIILMI